MGDIKTEISRAGLKTAGKPRPRQLTPYLKGCSPDHILIDQLTRAAISIEQALLRLNAVPGKHYNYIDLIRLSMPLVISERSNQE